MEKVKSRKSIRLSCADYSKSGRYFLTICTLNRRCTLSRINVGTGVPDGPLVELLPYGKTAEKYINQLNEFYDDMQVEHYVIMPNHIDYL